MIHGDIQPKYIGKVQGDESFKLLDRINDIRSHV